MIELALRDEEFDPYVERLPGPIVRLNIPSHLDISSALNSCRDDLTDSIHWALTSVYAQDDAPARVFVRNPNGQEMLTMVDPCTTYGSQAIVRS